MTSMAMWMLLAGRAAAGVHRRPARPQHARAPAGQDRRDRRPLGEQAGRGVPLIALRLARHGSARRRATQIEIPHLGSLHPDAQLGRPDSRRSRNSRREDRPNSTIVFWTFRVMVGLGLPDDRCSALWAAGRAGAAAPLPIAAVPALRAVDGARRAGRDPRRLVHHRDRPPAVGRLRRDAHRRRGVARTAPRSSASRSRCSSSSTSRCSVPASCYMLRLIGKGPVVDEARQPVAGGPGQSRHPMRPLSAAPDASPRPGLAAATGV